MGEIVFKVNHDYAFLMIMLKPLNFSISVCKKVKVKSLLSM